MKEIVASRIGLTITNNMVNNLIDNPTTSVNLQNIILYSCYYVIIRYYVIRPHRSRPTTYVDAAYCYRPSIAWSVDLSVGLSVILVSPAKMAEPIKMPFELRTWVGPGNHVLDGGPDPP